VSLRYYLYISDSKVEMMLPQIDPGFGRISESEIGFDFKLVGAKRKFEATSNRIARLERVVRYLDDFADVGTVDEPGQYFRGRMPMRWGPIMSSSLVYFGGATERTVVGLGGAAGHLHGEKGLADPFAPSSLPGIVAGLRGVLAADGATGQPEALPAAHLAHRHLRGTEQDLEFVAKRLAYGPSPYPELDPHEGMKVLVGSPIFVALGD
jgi:hypothetical protein